MRYEVPPGDARFGRLFPCQNTPADSPVFDDHGLTLKERQLEWKSITPRENIGNCVRLLKTALQRGKGLGYLYGGPGLAKTLLLKILCAEWARAGKGIFHYTTLPLMLEDLRSAYDDDDPQRALIEKERKYTRFPLLAIDEVGAERQTDFATEKFFSLVDKRHEEGVERGEEFLTVLAGNLSPAELDYRIADRLMDGRNFVFLLTGESYRPALRW